MDHIDQPAWMKPQSPEVASFIDEYNRSRDDGSAAAAAAVLRERQRAFQALCRSGAARLPTREVGASSEVQECEIRASADGPPEAQPRPGGEHRTARLEAGNISIHEPKSGGACQLRGYDGFTSTEADSLVKRLGRYHRGLSSVPALVEYLRLTPGLGQVGDVPTYLRADRLESCGSYLEFRHFFTHPDRPVKLAGANFCQQHLMCGLCAIRRAAKSLRAYLPKIASTIKPGMYAYLGTHTQPGGPILREQVKRLHYYLSRFWEMRRNWRHGRSKHEISSVNGAVFSIEVKRGGGTRGGGWHVHAHSLLLANRELDPAAIASEWSAVTLGAADPKAQCIQPVHSMCLFDSEDLTEASLVDGLAGDVVEVFKYPLKFSELLPADQFEAFKVLFNRRLLRSMGSLYRVTVDPSYLDEPLQVEDLPYVRLLFRHTAGGYVGDGRFFVDKAIKGC